MLKLVWLGLFIFVIALGSNAIIAIWPKFLSTGPSDVIVVKAVEGPIKVKPENPGGMIVAHKDLQVIEILKNGIVDTDDVETLRPIPSEPEPPPISEGKIDSTTVGSSENDATKSGPIKSPTAADLNNDNALSKKNNTVKTIVEQPKAKPTPRLSNNPFFVIQLAAFRSDEKATEIASLLSEKHSSRLEGIKLETMRLDTVVNGVFFRVVSTPIERVEAESACNRLRRAGQDCFLRKIAVTGD